MSEQSSSPSYGDSARAVTVNYWAAARAAAGTDSDVLEIDGDITLEQLLETIRLRHVDRPKFKDVVSVCSLLIGDRPVGTTDPAAVVVHPGDTVEMLPPFAGG